MNAVYISVILFETALCAALIDVIRRQDKRVIRMLRERQNLINERDALRNDAERAKARKKVDEWPELIG